MFVEINLIYFLGLCGGSLEPGSRSLQQVLEAGQWYSFIYEYFHYLSMLHVPWSSSKFDDTFDCILRLTVGVWYLTNDAW